MLANAPPDRALVNLDYAPKHAIAQLTTHTVTNPAPHVPSGFVGPRRQHALHLQG
jgi:hypothetical protein